MDTKPVWNNCFKEAARLAQTLSEDSEFINQCSHFSRTLIEAYSNGANIFICGNGGSYCDALHFAEELTGRYRKERRPLGAMALGEASHTTCVSNDIGFEHVFSRQLEALGRKNDVLITLTTSGNSMNLFRVVESAKQLGIHSVGLLGKGGGKLAPLLNQALLFPGETSDRIQELHMLTLHTVIETVERELFPENYA